MLVWLSHGLQYAASFFPPLCSVHICQTLVTFTPSLATSTLPYAICFVILPPYGILFCFCVLLGLQATRPNITVISVSVVAIAGKDVQKQLHTGEGEVLGFDSGIAQSRAALQVAAAQEQVLVACSPRI